MRLFSKLCMLAAVVFLAAAMPAFSQQVKGDSEVGLNGSLAFTHSSPMTVQGLVVVNYGYYFRKNDLAGFTNETLVQKSGSGSTASTAVLEYIQGHYRHLFPIKSKPKLYPFLGAMGGGIIMNSAGGGSGSGITGDFIGTGEAGIKYYMTKKIAFETAYNFEYEKIAGGGFADNSLSNILFGFTYTFGGPKAKH